jgi:hypothetical protein
MARAYGSSAHLLMKRETVYGQAATGNYIRMPFNRCNLGSEQGLIDDPLLGQGRDPLAQDVINDEGDIAGRYWYLACGQPVRRSRHHRQSRWQLGS